MSEAHLGRYCADFGFRYNTRKITDAERTDAAMIGARGKWLTYRRPVAAGQAQAASEPLASAPPLLGSSGGEVVPIVPPSLGSEQT